MREEIELFFEHASQIMLLSRGSEQYESAGVLLLLMKDEHWEHWSNEFVYGYINELFAGRHFKFVVLIEKDTKRLSLVDMGTGDAINLPDVPVNLGNYDAEGATEFPEPFVFIIGYLTSTGMSIHPAAQPVMPVIIDGYRVVKRW